MTTDQKWIERVEEARDLRRQINELAADDEQEIQFQEWSPGRKIVTIWSLESGEEVMLPRYQAAMAINSGRWTAYKDKAPKQRENKVKCFLHEDAAERPIMDELGISYKCPASKLANNGAKRIHAMHRHPVAWQQYQEHLADLKEEEYKAEARQEREAIMKLAEAAGKK